MTKPCLVLLLLLLPACASRRRFRPSSQRLPSEGTRDVAYEVDRPKAGPAENEAGAGYSGRASRSSNRGSIERIIEEQQFSLMHGSEASILRAGHLFAELEAVLIWSKPE